MKDIKTRDHNKTIRTLDKAAVAGEKMKNVSVRMKDNTISRSQDDADSSSEYSSQVTNRISGGVAHDAKQTLVAAQKRAKSASSRKKAPSHDRVERGRKKAKGSIKQKQSQTEVNKLDKNSEIIANLQKELQNLQCLLEANIVSLILLCQIASIVT